MNNPNIRFSINNSVGFNQNNHDFQSSHISNINPSRSDSNLIRPIPKKVDLSRMIYQQFLDPYPKQSQPGLLEMSEVVSHNLLSKMYQNAMSHNISQNTNGNRLNEYPHQLQNPNLSYNSPRFSNNQFLTSNNNINRSDNLKNQYYANSMNLPRQHMPVLSTNMDSYMYNNANHQVPLRHNQMTNITYMSIKDKEEKSMKKELFEEGNPSSKIQYYPKVSLSDDLIESHFSMSLNSHLKVDFKNQESLIIASKQERITKKPTKQQLKSEIEKPNKALKRAKKSKNIAECFDSLIQNSSQEISHTLCATPSDSSISPNSMVSCRSTITPQTIYPNFNNLVPMVNSHNINNLFSTANTEKSDASLSFQKSHHLNSILSNERENRKQSNHESHIQGLPLKKRIKWQIETDINDCSEQMSKGNEVKMTDNNNLKMQHIFQSIEADNKSITTDKNDCPIFVSEDPLKTFQKTFLPMEKHSNSSETESDDDVVVNCKYQFSLKDKNDLLCVDNNI